MSIQLRRHLVIGQFNFSIGFLCFHWSPSIGKLRMTPVSFVKSTESYEVCRWVTGIITTSNQTVWAVHSCNIRFLLNTSMCMQIRMSGWIFLIHSFQWLILKRTAAGESGSISPTINLQIPVSAKVRWRQWKSWELYIIIIIIVLILIIIIITFFQMKIKK